MDKFLVKRPRSDTGENVEALPEESCASQNHELEESDRVCLTLVLDVTRLILQQGWPFHGQHEMDPLNKGNFLELAEFIASGNPEIAKVVSLNAPFYNQMTSPLVQKQMANACSVETVLAIVRDIAFTLLVYESRDKPTDEVGVILRYVNKLGEVIERFIGTVDVAEISSACLKDAIGSLFSNHGLSFSRLRGQGFDGVTNMRDEMHGLMSLILKENSSAQYVHCFAQQLDLVVANVAKSVAHISAFFLTVRSIVDMSGSSVKIADEQRQLEHDRIVQELESGGVFNGRGSKEESSLLEPTDTRWGSHYATLTKLLTMWQSVIEVLENACYDGTEVGTRATTEWLFRSMETYEFVLYLHLMKNVLGITNELSNCLQERDRNIIQAMHHIETVKILLKDLKENGWEKFAQEVETFCKVNTIPVPNMEETMPRAIRHKRDGTVVTRHHFYRVEIFGKVLHLVEQEIEKRFTESSIELLTCVTCLDPRDSFSKFNVEKLVRLAELYTDDFSPVGRRTLHHQLKNYISHMRSDKEFSGIQDLQSLSKKMVASGLKSIFPMVYRLIELALVLPVTTASVEREFSAMLDVKTELLNEMGDECRNDNLVVYIERDIFAAIDNETILQRFQTTQAHGTQ